MSNLREIFIFLNLKELRSSFFCGVFFVDSIVFNTFIIFVIELFEKMNLEKIIMFKQVL